MKNWWKENGLSVVVGIAIGLGGYFGWEQYQSHTIETKKSASQAYEILSEINIKDNTDEFVKKANELKNDHADTAYALLASLHLAKLSAEKADWAAAEKELDWAVQKTQGSELQPIFKVRLARLYNAQEKHQQAITLLEGIKEEAYTGMTNIVLGDAYLAMGDKEKARALYEVAGEKTNSYIVKNELEMLVDDLTTPGISINKAAEAPANTTEEAKADENKQGS
nr:tetratricopeptide repeat protein [Pleionea sp. CnH1-48]